ncbi:MAG: DUF3108 domain-containing protein [Bacteroidota bacterium]|jgi:hypothetical protein
MKKVIFIAALLATGHIGKNQNAPTDEVLYEIKPLPNKAFTFGERLTYRIHYGMLNGGNAYFEVDDKAHAVNDRQTYRIKVYGKSAGLVDVMFKVRDEYESYMDVDALVPWKATKNVREGGYRDTDFIMFDHRRRIASSRRGQLTIPEGTKDLVSSIYFARTMDMVNARPGDVFPVTFYLDHKNYEFRFKFLGRETIDTEMGRFNALKVKPQVIEGRVFKDQEAITMWVTDDENKIPLRVQSEIWVGSLKADLIEMKGIRNPLSSKVK